MLRPAMTLFLVLTLLCSIIYPLFITVIGKMIFPQQASGSLVVRQGKLIGSSLIGQHFFSPKYFWGRPSATTPMPNNASASNASNLSISNPTKIALIKMRIRALKAADPSNTALIPVDLVTASASGLDPELSLAAIYYQAPRVARSRNLPIEQVHHLINKHTVLRYFNFLGEPRVNVLALNLDLDQL